MTNDTNNGGPRFVEDVVDAALDTIDRLRDLVPREVPIHVPDAMERWKADADARDRARRAEDDRDREHQAERARARAEQTEVQQAEVEAGWAEWIDGRLTEEREKILEIVAEVVGQTALKLRDEAESKVTTLTRRFEQERTVLRHARDRARERAKSMQQAYAEKVATLQAQINAQQRAIDLLEIRLREHKERAAWNAETSEGLVTMMRELYERALYR
jgi:hypothetical protein